MTGSGHRSDYPSSLPWRAGRQRESRSSEFGSRGRFSGRGDNSTHRNSRCRHRRSDGSLTGLAIAPHGARHIPLNRRISSGTITRQMLHTIALKVLATLTANLSTMSLTLTCHAPPYTTLTRESPTERLHGI